MKTKILVLACALAFVTACHDSPSTSDAKAVITGRLNGGCSRLAIDDFTRVNGVATGDRDYDVAVTYTLVIKPPQGDDISEADYKSQWQALDQKLQQVLHDQDQLAPQVRDASQRADNPAGTPADQQLKAALVAKYDAFTTQIQDLKQQESTLHSRPTQDISRDCPNINSDILATIAHGVDDFRQKNPDAINAYLSGFSVSGSDTIHLMKTDNGWKENL